MHSFWPRAAVAACTLLAAAILTGCGGGTSNGGAALTTRVITEANNFAWNYSIISSTATPTGGGATVPVTGIGTATISTVAVPANFGGATLQLSITGNVSVNGGPQNQYSIIYYFTQDVNGNLIECAQSTTDSSGTITKIVQTPSLVNSELVPGTFAQGEVVSSPMVFTDTTSAPLSETIGPATLVGVPAGFFNVWPMAVTINGTPVGTQYWDPAIGLFVKGEIKSFNVNLGGTAYNMDVTYVLTSTNA